MLCEKIYKNISPDSYKELGTVRVFQYLCFVNTYSDFADGRARTLWNLLASDHSWLLYVTKPIC